MNFAFIRRRLRSLSSLAPRRDRRHGLGRRGERAAARYLRRKHHHILARNYRCAAGEIDLISAGEIDLISADGDTLVFVEVKTRSSDTAEDPQETFRRAQWKRVERAARFFLMERSAQDNACRFDLVTVVWPPHGSPQIEHFEDVFQPQRA